MVASTDIKWFSSDNLNAPQLTNDWGVMIGVLDACLINGFSVQSIASLTASGTTVTATFNTAHQYKQYQVIEISGAAQAEFNGQARILTVPNGNSITFELASAPSTNTATGSIACKLPALDWLKPFGDTGQKAAYRSKNTLLASRPFLRVDNGLDPAYVTTYAKFAKVGIVENMADIDTLQGVQAPYDPANPNKNWVGQSGYNGWSKWWYAMASGDSGVGFDKNSKLNNSPSDNNRTWYLAGNQDYFFLLNTSHADNPVHSCYGFGAFESLLAMDSGNAFLSSTLDYVNNNNSNYYPAVSGLGPVANNKPVLLHRNYLNNAESASATGCTLLNVAQSGRFNLIAAPEQQGRIMFTPIYLKEGDVLRGKLPCIHWLLQQQPYPNRTVFVDDDAAYLAVNTAPDALTAGQIVLAIGSL